MFEPNIQVAKFHLDEVERRAKPYRIKPGASTPSWTNSQITLIVAVTAVSLVVGVFTIA